MRPASLLGSWARLLIHGLAEAGIRDVIISPGSRSTPFVVAALDHPELRCHQVIDERSAGFVALGHARATGQPALLLCTSGTAGLHYLPALVEAATAHHPLVVLTADRPFELQGCGAAQTIDQVGLYGPHVRRSFELGAPDPDPRALRGLVRTAVQACFLASHPLPGPVHINARVRKPLEPQAVATEDDAGLDVLLRSILAEPVTVPTAPEREPATEAIQALADWCHDAQQGVLVAGPAAAHQAGCRDIVRKLSTVTGFPLLAEAASQLRVPELEPISSFDALVQLGAFDGGHRPDLIIQLGASPTSAVWGRFIDEHRNIRRVVLSDWAWPDPHNSADQIVIGDLHRSIDKLCQAVHKSQPLSPNESSQRAQWVARLQDGEGRVRAAQAEILSTGEDDRTEPLDIAREELTHDPKLQTLREAQVSQALVASLPEDALLMVGNSLPIRALDSWVPVLPEGVTVLSQRGASGIDGLISGGLGAALATGRPTAVVLGDVSLLHDLSILAMPLAGSLATPLVIVALNNDGGRIFEQLPIATSPALKKQGLDFWTTPHGVDLSAVGDALGLACHRVQHRSSLDDALARCWQRPGLSLVEAVVPQHGAAEDASQLREVLGAAELWAEGPAPSPSGSGVVQP